MAVARIEPVPARRYTPGRVRHAANVDLVDPPRRTTRPWKVIVLGLVLAGAGVQHLLVTVPLEPQPAPLTVSAALGAPAQATGGGLTARIATTDPGDVIIRPARRSPPSSIAAPHRVSVSRIVPAHPTHAAPPAAGATAGAPTKPASALLPPVGAVGDGARVALAANPQALIMHVPSVSVGAIRDALRAAGSPALDAQYADGKDVAEYIWDEGRVLGIDPAVLMGIFYHESVYGTAGMASQTLSVGNIRPLDGQPQLDGYRLYRSWQEGIDDCYRLLRSYARGGATTVATAIPVWAPPTDNNDDSAYISAVLTTMNALYTASVKV